MGKAKDGVGCSTARAARALSHPLRVHILLALEDRDASPNLLSNLLDQPLSNVSYHVKTLRDFGWVEEVETRPVRGAVEHFYRLVPGVTIEAPAVALDAIQQLLTAWAKEEGAETKPMLKGVSEILKRSGRRGLPRKAIKWM